MKILKFLIQRGSRRLFIAAAIAGAVSGFSSTGLLIMTNTLLSGKEWDGPGDSRWIFVSFCLLVPVTIVVAQNLMARLTQKAVLDMRADLSRQLLGTPLRQLEQLGSHRLLVALTSDIQSIATALQLIPAIFIHGTLGIGCVVYLGWLAPDLLLGLFAILAIGALGYLMPHRYALNQLEEARRAQETLFEHFRGVTDGTKELKLHSRRRRSFLGLMAETLENLRGRSVSASTTFSVSRGLGQLLLFAVIGFLLFSEGPTADVSRGAITGYILILLFLLSPLQAMLSAIPTLGNANISLERVRRLGISLESEGTMTNFGPDPHPDWGLLELHDVTYTHVHTGQARDFTIGPVDFELHPGEIVFLTGGNGSGKTTFAKVILGLYTPDDGTISLDGQVLDTPEQIERYRQHFAAVFADYYLFESLLGLEHPELQTQADKYLERLELEGKVKVEDGRFSTIALSQGQKKRLALLTAYLEDRPIYVFDEWAAEQDPIFREIFYLKMLPELKERGKAVVVISHDDRYFHVADRIVKLDYGKVVYEGDPENMPALTESAALPAPREPAAAPASAEDAGMTGDAGETGDAGDTLDAKKRPVAAMREKPPAVQRRLGEETTSPTAGKILRIAAGFLAALVPVLAVLAGLGQLEPIGVQDADAPAETFSAVRAMEHVEAIARSPRPMGSPEHARVRDYLIGQLARLGLEAEIQRLPVSRDTGTAHHMGTVQNVLARLPGQGGSSVGSSSGDSPSALLLLAHYDSDMTSPGAADDGAGLATILETLRALRAGEPLDKDVIVLFSDGEEIGLLGARAFVNEHPWFYDVAAVINHEARGSSGPALMFQSSDGAKRLVEAFGEAAPHPVSGSYFSDLYRLLPYETDLTVFLRAAVPGLNFAFVGSPGNYHTALDEVDRLDPASLQHMGSTTLALVRRLSADSGALEPVAEDAIFFNLLPGTLTLHSRGLVMPLAFAAVLLVLLALGFARRQGRLQLGNAFVSALALLLVPAAALATAFFLRVILAASLGGIATLRWGRTDLLAPGVLCAAAAAGLFLMQWLTPRRGGPANLAAGGLIFWTVLTLIVATALPATSYLFTVPLALGAVAYLALTVRPGRPDLIAALVIAACAVPVILLWTAPLEILRTVLGFDSLVLLAGLLGLLLLVLAPLAEIMARAGRLIPLGFFAAALVFLGWGAAQSGYDADHPKPDSLFYVLEPERKRARWATFDPEPDEYTRQVLEDAEADTLRGIFGSGSRQVLATSAPLLDLPTGTVKLVEDLETEDGRQVRLRIVAPPEARMVRLDLSSDAPIRAVAIDDERFDTPPRFRQQADGTTFAWSLGYFAPPQEGFELVAELGIGQPLRMNIVEETLGLPEAPGLEIEPRPPELRPSSRRPTDTVFVRFDYTF